MHFGMTGLDFENLSVELSNKWQDSDKSIYFVQNFTDVREAIEVKWKGKKVENDTIGTEQATWTPGQNLVFNQTEIR